MPMPLPMPIAAALFAILALCASAPAEALAQGPGSQPVLGQAQEQQRAQRMAHNYVLARSAAHNAVLHAAAQAKALPAGEAWLPGAPQCRTPVQRSACSPPMDASALSAFAPAHWQVAEDGAGAARWKIRVQDGLCYVYGSVSMQEMAAIRVLTRYSSSTALCGPGAVGSGSGESCLPALMRVRPDGSREGVPLPGDIQSLLGSGHGEAGVVVSVIGVWP